MNWLSLVIAVLLTHVPENASDLRWKAALEGFDQLRAQAFMRDDPMLLAWVYPKGSDLLRADRRTLAAYRLRQVKVQHMSMRSQAVTATVRKPRKVRLNVVDQLSKTVVRLPDGSLRRLPQDRLSSRTLELAHTDRGWRITSVRQR